ncbi:MAG: geobacillin-26 family protein [Lachnospirales bacterium]
MLTTKVILEDFRSYVDDVNAVEFALISSVGGGIAVTIIAAVATSGLAAGLAAADGTAATSASIGVLNNAINNADYYYGKVFFN